MASQALAEHCHMGLDKLVETHGAFYSIYMKTKSMIQDTGTLNALQSTFGVPGEKASFDRHLRKLTNATEVCREQCDELDKSLQAWRASVDEFSRRISKTKGWLPQTPTSRTDQLMMIDIMNQQENATNKEIGTLKTEINDQMFNQDRAQANEDAARARREDLSRQKNKLADQIGTIIQSAGSAGIGGKMLVAGGQMAATWMLNLWASNDLQSAQSNMQDQLERGQEYRRRKEEAEVDIQKLSTQANELKQCIEVLQPVQLLLHGIIDCLRNAAIHHNEMLAKMQLFLESCSESKDIATGIPDGLSFGDTLDFLNEIQLMRQGALEIGHWSLIYSKVIQQTMMKGFQQNETNFSHEDVLFTIQQSRQQAIESGSAKLIAGQLKQQHEAEVEAIRKDHDEVVGKLRRKNEKELKKVARSGKMRRLLPFSKAS
ncbi:uncharacterized protein FSUBG_4965 [Fusarium subglutinans]|uniref:Uncharacterized protein n=1 Tax=Gibberella subglutinans TaxID=42677 RepID=A0A8H5V3D9_GIBSU|nr:uncharacterized protein FSUBG_4965 [Fusarium subglutinans]KAF5607863.1 hypothetical protein FSUBG_4965 [Fusarium subglutinans]